jgi:hypothetical protein
VLAVVMALHVQPIMAQQLPDGSTYIPVDSWIYPAFERLASLGLAPSAFIASRPWTRNECTRLLRELEDAGLSHDSARDRGLLAELKREFQMELKGESAASAVDSVYISSLVNGDRVMNDGFHFAQSQVNEFGRQYGKGYNQLVGFAGRFSQGPFFSYVRAEYQGFGSPFIASPTVLNEIGTIDQISFPAAPLDGRSNRLRLLDAYAGLNWKNLQLSIGKQSLWWGPNADTSLMLSNNSDPLRVARLATTLPVRLPWILSWLGPVKIDMFFGQLSGHQFTFAVPTLYGPKLKSQPLIHGERFTFKPTENLEIGVSRTAITGGDGVPLTFGTIFRSYFSAGNFGPGFSNDPGDRRSGFDFRYRIPGLRKYVTLYTDSMTEDEYSPLAYPRRSAFAPGVYVSQIPGARRFDLRIEGVYTNLPGLRQNAGYFFYNGRYRSGYTNNGMLISSWVGRQGQGISASTRLWLQGSDMLQFYFRRTGVDRSLLQGGNLTTAGFTLEKNLHTSLRLQFGIQMHSWRFPIITAARQTTASGQIRLHYSPSRQRQVK